VSMVGPTGKEGTVTMKDNRDVEMGIGGEGVGASGERKRTEETLKERRTRRIQSWEM